MTNDHENSVTLGIVCKWRELNMLTVHTFSTIVEYKYHGKLDVENININPVAILKNNFGDRINLSDIEILDKVYYICDMIERKTPIKDLQHYHNIYSDASFVMPYETTAEFVK